MDGGLRAAVRGGGRRTASFGWLLLAGGGLAAVTVALPPAATGSDAAVLALGTASALTGIVLIAVRREVSEWALGLVLVLATVLIAVASREGGAVGTGTADNEMLFVWVCLYSFYFFGLPHAVLQLAGVGTVYAWLLSAQSVPLDEAATRWFVTLATLLVAGLLVARLRSSLHGLLAELADRARLDSLTGLLNRRALKERAAIEFARSRREETPIAMLAADIDGFKALNDRLGHVAGDRVLLHVARTLSAETREVDALARLGGDEFAVLLPATSAMGAMLLAERLRTTVERSASDASLRITLSVGVAVGHGATYDLEGLWDAADQAMYEAKRAGGNRVAVAHEGSGPPTRDEIAVREY